MKESTDSTMVHASGNMKDMTSPELEASQNDILERLNRTLNDKEYLAERILDAARLASAYHMMQQAQDLRSQAEAEYSAGRSGDPV